MTPERFDEVAADIARCAAMLRGGVAPDQVFGLLATEPRASAALRGIGGRVASGVPVVDALSQAGGPEWRLLAAAWQLAEETGSPLAPALDRISAGLRSLAALQERRSVVMSGPRATVRLVTSLPPVALVLGWALGFDPTPVLLSPIGAVLVAGGTLLLGVGAHWSRELTRRVQGADRVAGAAFDLVWIAVGGGNRPDAAVRRVLDVVDRFDVRWVPFDDFLHDARLRTSLRRAERLGVPVRSVLLDEAAATRARSIAELERAAERLGVRILLPLGLCVLPAFMVLGVLPVVISMVTGSRLV